MFDNSFFYVTLALVIIAISHKSLIFLNILSIIKDYYVFLFKHHLINLFVLVPCLLSVSICLKTNLNNNTIDNMMIIIVLLISVYYSYYSFYSEKNYADEKDQKVYSDKLKNAEQCLLIISYNILISIVSLIMCFISYDNGFSNYYLRFVITISIYYLFIQSLFNLMIIMKRNYKLK